LIVDDSLKSKQKSSMRKFYAFRDGTFVELGSSSDSPTTQIMTDEIPPTVHPCNGEIYTSSKKFREVTRQYGCVEYGQDVPRTKRPEYKIPEGVIERIYADLSVASGKNEKTSSLPRASEYFKRLANDE